MPVWAGRVLCQRRLQSRRYDGLFRTHLTRAPTRRRPSPSRGCSGGGPRRPDPRGRTGEAVHSRIPGTSTRHVLEAGAYSLVAVSTTAGILKGLDAQWRALELPRAFRSPATPARLERGLWTTTRATRASLANVSLFAGAVAVCVRGHAGWARGPLAGRTLGRTGQGRGLRRLSVPCCPA